MLYNRFSITNCRYLRSPHEMLQIVITFLKPEVDSSSFHVMKIRVKLDGIVYEIKGPETIKKKCCSNLKNKTKNTRFDGFNATTESAILYYTYILRARFRDRTPNSRYSCSYFPRPRSCDSLCASSSSSTGRGNNLLDSE